MTDSDAELRKIEYGILELADQLDGNAGEGMVAERMDNWKRWLWLLLIPVAAVVLYLLLSKINDSPLSTVPEIVKTDTLLGDTDTRPGHSGIETNKSPANVKPVEKHPSKSNVPSGRVNPVTENAALKEKDSSKTEPSPVPPALPDVTPKRREYIRFTLFLNASSANYEIYIDGKKASIEKDNLTTKKIRVEKSEDPYLIEIRQNDTVVCKKQGIINNGDKIALPCSL